MTVWRATCRAEIKLDPLGSAVEWEDSGTRWLAEITLDPLGSVVEWEDSGTRCLADGEERPSWVPVTPRPLRSVRREKVGEA
jgi:hypothetical protein